MRKSEREIGTETDSMDCGAFERLHRRDAMKLLVVVYGDGFARPYAITPRFRRSPYTMYLLSGEYVMAVTAPT